MTGREDVSEGTEDVLVAEVLEPLDLVFTRDLRRIFWSTWMSYTSLEQWLEGREGRQAFWRVLDLGECLLAEVNCLQGLMGGLLVVRAGDLLAMLE